MYVVQILIISQEFRWWKLLELGKKLNKVPDFTSLITFKIFDDKFHSQDAARC